MTKEDSEFLRTQSISYIFFSALWNPKTQTHEQLKKKEKKKRLDYNLSLFGN